MFISSPPPPPPPTPVEVAEWITETVEDKIVSQGGAGRYVLGGFECVEGQATDFTCVSTWVHHGTTEYLIGHFTWNGDGYDCHGWTVSDEPVDYSSVTQ